MAADQARAAARDAEKRLARGEGDDLPPFLGVPISIKDLNDTAGIRTTHGTADLAPTGFPTSTTRSSPASAAPAS